MLRRAMVLLRFALSPILVSAWDLGIVQETGASAQLQTVQAQDYAGSYQSSSGLTWTLGADWNRLVAVRAGLTYRNVATSLVYQNTVYPGYVGWGWTVGVDYLPFRIDWIGGSWALGGTLTGGIETMEYPGLYRSFQLPGLTVAPLAEMIPFGTTGLAVRLRMPVSLDQRAGFRLAWRVGGELAVVFRGLGWTFP